MTRCIPAEPAFVTASEREVWLALKQRLRPEDVLLANVRLTADRGDFEADLVVAMPDAGVALIEVKGGNVWHDGTSWRMLRGGIEVAIDPVEQARRTMYALRDYLDGDPRWRRRRVRMAHLVALPHTAVAAEFSLPTCPRSYLLDRDDVRANPAGLVWDVLTAQDRGQPPAAARDVDDLVEVLGGRMLPQRDLLAEVAERQATVDLLTERQAAILSALRLLHRVEVRGGAGSGKTWLAVEQARRLAGKGQRVALLCYSRGLAAYLERRVDGLPARERPAYVGTFHYLGTRWGAPPGPDDDPDYFERRLPQAMTALAAARPAEERFDAVVVDEAQDFADSWWVPLLAALRDEESGGVYVFADEGQRVFARQGRPPLSLVPVVLDENLRNTRQIAQVFGGLAPMQMRYRGGDGAPVRFVPCATEDALGAADDEAVRLLDEGWAPEHIALLTTGHRHPEQTARQAGGQERYWDTFWAGEDLFYGHVLGFKGLERPALVLAVNGFRDAERAREMLYVGLSRARDLLVVCGDPETVRAVGGEGVRRRLMGA